MSRYITEPDFDVYHSEGGHLGVREAQLTANASLVKSEFETQKQLAGDLKAKLDRGDNLEFQDNETSLPFGPNDAEDREEIFRLHSWALRMRNIVRVVNRDHAKDMERKQKERAEVDDEIAKYVGIIARIKAVRENLKTQGKLPQPCLIEGCLAAGNMLQYWRHVKQEATKQNDDESDFVEGPPAKKQKRDRVVVAEAGDAGETNEQSESGGPEAGLLESPDFVRFYDEINRCCADVCALHNGGGTSLSPKLMTMVSACLAAIGGQEDRWTAGACELRRDLLTAVTQFFFLDNTDWIADTDEKQATIQVLFKRLQDRWTSLLRCRNLQVDASLRRFVASLQGLGSDFDDFFPVPFEFRLAAPGAPAVALDPYDILYEEVLLDSMWMFRGDHVWTWRGRHDVTELVDYEPPPPQAGAVRGKKWPLKEAADLCLGMCRKGRDKQWWFVDVCLNPPGGASPKKYKHWVAWSSAFPHVDPPASKIEVESAVVGKLRGEEKLQGGEHRG